MSTETSSPVNLTPEQLRSVLGEVLQAGCSVSWRDVLKQSGILFFLLLSAVLVALEMGYSAIGPELTGWGIAGVVAALGLISFLSVWLLHVREFMKLQRLYELTMAIPDESSRQYVATYLYPGYRAYRNRESVLAQLKGSLIVALLVWGCTWLMQVNLGYVWSPVLALILFPAWVCITQDWKLEEWATTLAEIGEDYDQSGDFFKHRYGTTKVELVDNTEGWTVSRMLFLIVALSIAIVFCRHLGFKQIIGNAAQLKQLTSQEVLRNQEFSVGLGVSIKFKAFDVENDPAPEITAILNEVLAREQGRFHKRPAPVLEKESRDSKGVHPDAASITKVTGEANRG